MAETNYTLTFMLVESRFVCVSASEMVTGTEDEYCFSGYCFSVKLFDKPWRPGFSALREFSVVLFLVVAAVVATPAPPTTVVRTVVVICETDLFEVPTPMPDAERVEVAAEAGMAIEDGLSGGELESASALESWQKTTRVCETWMLGVHPILDPGTFSLRSVLSQRPPPPPPPPPPNRGGGVEEATAPMVAPMMMQPQPPPG
jgi:hypothetical protein